MTKIKKIIILMFSSIILSSCGFKAMNNVTGNSYAINNIKIEGNKRVGHLLKKIIYSHSTNASEILLDVNIRAQKKTKIKERNISYKTTKKNMVLNIDIEMKNIRNNKVTKSTFSQELDYTIGISHSSTLNNEKTALSELTDRISQDVIIQIKRNL